MRTMKAHPCALVAIALVLAGCSSAGDQATTSPPKTQVVTNDSTQAAIDAAKAAEQRKQDEAKAAQAEQEAAVNEAASARPTSVSMPQASAACTSDVLLAAVADLFPDNDRWNPTGVDIAECQAGYARVFVVPDLSVCTSEAPDCLEHEQVFLHDNGGMWEYVDSGTGLSCQDQPTPVTIAEACAALGLL